MSTFTPVSMFPSGIGVQVRLVHRMDAPMVLWTNDFLTSSDGRFTAFMQSDGNLVIYKAGSPPIWASNTAGNSGARLSLRSDGNLVIMRPSGAVIWSTNTYGANHFLRMQSDGNLVLYRGSQALWATNTCCQ